MKYTLAFAMAAASVATHVPAFAQSATGAPELVQAHFETRVCARPCKKPRVRDWFMFRTPDRLELRDARTPVSEIWRWQSDKSTVAYQYLMHDDKRVIEYAPVDLALIGKTPDWKRLRHIVTEQDLAHLKRVGSTGKTKARPATERWVGRVQGVQIDVRWNPAEALPEQVTYTHPGHAVTVTRLHTGKALPVAVTTESALASYIAVDYADLGDMEHSPDEQVWIRKAMQAPGHEHHDHDAHGH